MGWARTGAKAEIVAETLNGFADDTRSVRAAQCPEA